VGRPPIQGTGYVVIDLGYKTPCCIWQHSRNNRGYAFRKSETSCLVHRAAWEAIHGPVPKGLELDHLCKRGANGCVNPDHLEAVSHTQNVRRGSRVKLTEDKVREAFARYKNGETQTSIARDMGVHSSIISEAVRGKIWKGVVSI
jgi:hypothetical protein